MKILYFVVIVMKVYINITASAKYTMSFTVCHLILMHMLQNLYYVLVNQLCML